MGIKERREREKQITKQAILVAARQIGRENGWPALTIRKVAEQIEYSPPMVYEYFTSKEDMLLALAKEGYQQLELALQQAQVKTQDPQQRLFQIAEAYLQFAKNNPDLYQVMNGLGGVAVDATEIAKEIEQVCEIPLKALQEWATFVKTTLPNPMTTVEILWCLLHGIVSLTIVNRIDSENSSEMVRQTLEGLLFAWSKK